MLSIRPPGGETSGSKAAKSVSLADLRGHRVSVTWNDAVSVVLELADALADGQFAGGPAMSDVQLLSGGRVRITEVTASAEPPVMSLAGVLQALLKGTKPPAELSALAADNLGPAVRHKSLEEFRHALGFFDRPGRREMLAALYERASKAMGSADFFGRLKARAENSTGVEGEASDESEGDSRGRNLVATLVGLSFIVAVVGGGLWWKQHRVASRKAAAARAARQAAEAEAERRRGWPVYAGASSTDPLVGRFRTTGASEALARVAQQPKAEPALAPQIAQSVQRQAAQTFRPAGGTVNVPAEVTFRPASAVNAKKPAQPSWTESILQTSKVLFARAQKAVDAMVDKGFALYARLTAGQPSADEAPVVADVTPREAESARAGAGRPRSSPRARGPLPGKDRNMELLVFGRQPEPAEAVPASVAPAARVYTAADAEIVPPTILKPQLPKQPRSGVRHDEAGSLDLLISERGSVEHVRLVSPGNRFQDRMLVSAAKTWLFAPATLDGAPVKFRARVPITW
jgi:hypothetical protein